MHFATGQCRYQHGLSSLSEPGLNLFNTVPLGAAVDGPLPPTKTKDPPPPEIKDAQLRAE